MSVKIRLMRVGKKKQPTYRVVVADSRQARDGRIIETIGHYGPREEPSRIEIDGDKALGWLRKGAQPSEQVQKLLTILGVWATFESEKGDKPIVTKLNRRGYSTGRGPQSTKGKKKPEEPKADAPAAPAADDAPAADAEAPAAEEPKAEEPKAEAPKAEAPKAEEPKAEEPKAEEPKAEEPTEDAPAEAAADEEKSE